MQCIQKLCKRFRKIEFKHNPRTKNELADDVSTIASMIKHSDTEYIGPLDIELKEHPVYCSHVEAEPDGSPWYFDIRNYLETRTYPENVTLNQKNLIHRDLGLLRFVDAIEAARFLEQIHVGVCGMHMNGLTLETKIL